MNTTFYLDEFQLAANQLDKQLLHKKQMEVAVGVYNDSVFLKLYKRAWANPNQDPLTSPSRIFFSVWINDAAIREQKLLYNIHALKLRHLKGYSVQSRQFAAIFRERFKEVAEQWENVSIHFGPLTLMEGWVTIDVENFQEAIIKLATGFLQIEYLIDDTLTYFT